MRTAIVLIGLLSAVWSSADAATYHVATDGNDTAPGTEKQPWRTLQAAVDRLRPGDTLLVHEGNYPEDVLLRRSGGTGKPIVIQSRGADRVTLNPGSFLGRDCSHLRLRGFHIQNTRGDRAAIEFTGTGGFVEIIRNEITGQVARNAAALRVGGAMHDFVIATNHVHHNNTGNQEAIRVHNRTHDFQILGNIVTDNSNIGIDVVGWARYGKPYNGLIAGNRAHNNARQAPWASGIYLDGPDNIVVEYNISSGQPIGIQFGCEPSDDSSQNNICRYNLVYDNTEYGFSLGGYTGGTVHHCLIHNNVFKNNQREVGFSRNAGHHNTLVNNILFNPAGQSLNFLSQPRDTVIDFNCYFTRFGPTPGGDSVIADPRFVDLRRNDFHLRADSPCIDAGKSVAREMTDFDRRPVARPDIGAFEFVNRAIP
jgi:hypothetical protein